MSGYYGYGYGYSPYYVGQQLTAPPPPPISTAAWGRELIKAFQDTASWTELGDFALKALVEGVYRIDMPSTLQLAQHFKQRLAGYGIHP